RLCDPASLRCLSRTQPFANSFDVWRYRPRFQAVARAREGLVDDPPAQPATTNNELAYDAVYDYIVFVHAEIEQRFRSVIIEHKDARLLCIGGEPEARVDSVV